MQFERDVERVFSEGRVPMRAKLARQYSRTAISVVDDAIQDAFLEVWISPKVRAAWHQGGIKCLQGTVHVIAKRRLSKLNKELRRHTALLPHDGPVWEERRLQCRSTITVMHRLIPAAARRFGGYTPNRMARALRLRLAVGVSDREAAQRAGASRSQLNKARRWVVSQVRV